MRRTSIGMVLLAFCGLALVSCEKGKENEVRTPAELPEEVKAAPLPPLVKPVLGEDTEVPEPTAALAPGEWEHEEPPVLELIRKAEAAEAGAALRAEKGAADDRVTAAKVRMAEIDQAPRDWKGTPFAMEQIAAYARRRDLRRDVHKLEDALGMIDPIIAEGPNRIEIELEKCRAELKKAELAWQAVESGVWREMRK